MLAALLAVCVWYAQTFLPGPEDGYDLRAFWSAASAVSKGVNPYILDNLLEELPEAPPAAFLNPPQALLLVGFLANLSFDAARTCWWLVSTILFGLSAAIVVRSEPRSMRELFLSAACLASFLPVAIATRVGQLTPLVALGIAMILSELRRERKSGAVLIAGILLTSIKPHLAWLLLSYAAIREAPARGARFTAGLVAVIAVWAALPAIVSSGIYMDFFDMERPAALDVRMPVISSFFLDLGVDRKIGAIAGIVIGLAALFVSLRRGDNTLYLVPIGLVTAPYGWHYDLAVLVPVLAVVCSERPRSGIAGVLLLNALFVFTPREVHLAIWYPFALTALISMTRVRATEPE